jgi:MYXO-CTERM domain-containing protein
MRPILPLLLLLCVPITTAQAPLLEDPSGDVEGVLAGAAPFPAAGTWTALDLLALNLTEDPAGFTFEIRLQDIGGDEARTDYGSTQVRLTYGDCIFYVNQYRSSDNAAYFGNLYVFQGQTGSLVRGLRAERDLATDRIWTNVDRLDLACDGQVPGRGETFTAIRVLTYSSASGGLGSGLLRVGDTMPDEGEGIEYTVRFGGGIAQGARLQAPNPYYSSNGEAATYQFDLSAGHDGAEDARFRVFVENVPLGWNVTLPGEFVDLPANRPMLFPIYVTTVFRHQHGSAESFQLHIHEVDGERFATVDLGVHFLAVPQPAGHHSRLFVHSNDWSSTAAIVNAPLGASGGYLTMNTLEEDPSDTQKPAIGRSDVVALNSGDVGVSRFYWSVCLDPGLRLGLDFDLARQGTIEVPISSTRPLPAAHLTGRLLHLGAGEPTQYCSPFQYLERETTVLAELDFGAQEIAPDGQAMYAATVQPLPAADYIEAQEGALMVLELTLTATGMPLGGTGGANLDPGAWMQLPLNEYLGAIPIEMPTAGAPTVPGFVASEPESKDAASPTALLALAALAVVAFGRRRKD